MTGKGSKKAYTKIEIKVGFNLPTLVHAIHFGVTKTTCWTEYVFFVLYLIPSVNNLTIPYFVTGAAERVPCCLLFLFLASLLSVFSLLDACRYNSIESPLTLTALLNKKFMLYNSVFVKNVMCFVDNL